MQPSKDQLHQIWLQCMQMTECSQQNAMAFLQQVHQAVNTPLTHSGQTLLMLASSISSVNLVFATLHYKPQIHFKDSIGRTALHYAASVGSIEIFELLVKAGARVDELTIGGQTPLSKACMFGQGDIIEWYLNNYVGAFEVADKMGKKPLDALKTGGQALYQQVFQVYKQLTEDADVVMKE